MDHTTLGRTGQKALTCTPMPSGACFLRL